MKKITVKMVREHLNDEDTSWWSEEVGKMMADPEWQKTKMEKFDKAAKFTETQDGTLIAALLELDSYLSVTDKRKFYSQLGITSVKTIRAFSKMVKDLFTPAAWKLLRAEIAKKIYS